MVKISIGCMACTTLPKYLDEIKSVIATWYPDCLENDIPVYFFTGEKYSDEEKSLNNPNIIHLDGVDDSYNSASLKQWLGYKYLYDNVPSDFYMIVGTDNYIWGKNLLPIISKYNPSDPYLISGYGETRKLQTRQYHYFPFGGCGLILTHEALRRLYHRLPYLYEDWKTIVGTGSLLPACDLAMSHYAEEHNIVICRDYGLYSQNWVGMGKWGRLNEGPIQYEIAAGFHYMDDYNMRLYHKYKEVARFYHQLRAFTRDYPDANAYTNGKSLTHKSFTNTNSVDMIANTIKGMIDSSTQDTIITISGSIPEKILVLATNLMVKII
jgi:hypothetical protein